MSAIHMVEPWSIMPVQKSADIAMPRSSTAWGSMTPSSMPTKTFALALSRGIHEAIMSKTGRRCSRWLPWYAGQ